MAPTVLLLPSPFLPPLAYESLLVALGEIGYATQLADASDPTSGAHLAERWQPLVAGADVLVAHSNAGYLAPLAGLHDTPSVVFMDAALLPETGSTALAPARFREQLSTLADEQGRLPPWTRWWPRDAMADVIPPHLLDEIDRDCPRVPLAYLDRVVTVPTGWVRRPSAYLAFGETYADEVAFARAHGWPTTVLPGQHLQFLWDPTGVAQAVGALAQALR